MESYDVIGQWCTVDHEARLPIDANVTLPDHTAVTGISGLRADILKRPEIFVQAMTEKLMSHALGRELTYTDQPQIRAIVAEAARHDYHFSSLVLGVAASDAFHSQAEPGGSPGTPDTQVAARR